MLLAAIASARFLFREDFGRCRFNHVYVLRCDALHAASDFIWEEVFLILLINSEIPIDSFERFLQTRAINRYVSIQAGRLVEYFHAGHARVAVAGTEKVL